MDQETLQECLVEQLRDIYDAEKQLTKAIPKLAKGANSPELAEALNAHLEETQGQVTRLESVFEALGLQAKGKPCKAMRGLIEEGGEVLEEKDKGEARDLGIIAAAQRVEHYEIAAYGTVKAMAEQLENEEVVELLQATEDEEKSADSKLTEIAMVIYGSTEMESADSDEGDEDMPKTVRKQPAVVAAGTKTRKAAH